MAAADLSATTVCEDAGGDEALRRLEQILDDKVPGGPALKDGRGDLRSGPRAMIYRYDIVLICGLRMAATTTNGRHSDERTG